MLRLRFWFLGLTAVVVPDLAPGGEVIPDWPAPATWSPHSASRGASAMAAITSPLPFIGVTPCRQYDSRNTSPLPDNTPRAVTITGAPCGLPAIAAAVSLNVTVFDILGQGSFAVFRAGTSSPPTTAWINYAPGQGQIGNAGVLPLNGSGQVVFQVNQGGGSLDFTIDVNGYYAPAGIGTANTFLGFNAGNFTMIGDHNTGFGVNALSNNTTGGNNTASGALALFSNTVGEGNTACGRSALVDNTIGADNTASGAFALSNNNNGFNNTASGAFSLFSNTNGFANTASGIGALESNTSGSNNTANGASALVGNTTGLDNTAGGAFSLASNTAGFNNTASGRSALFSNTTGSDNIAIGYFAGSNLTTGNGNIDIGNSGVASESGTIRIGTAQTATYLAGVNGVMTGGTGTPVLIDASGQLGTISSSARFKDEIQDMGDTTDGLLKLRPVTFRYTAQAEWRKQYGLIAEEVEKVMPELVVCSSSGEAETILYYEMPAMLLNELQKHERAIQELKSELAALREVIGQR